MERRIGFLMGACLVAALVTGNILPSRAENYGTGDGPLGVAIGDLNGDGDPDMAVGNFWELRRICASEQWGRHLPGCGQL